MEAIVKVQVPLLNPDGLVLVYDEKRTHMRHQPMTTYMKQKMGDAKKKYFKGTYSSIVGWAIGDEVEAQPW